MTKFISLIRQRKLPDGEYIGIYDVISPDGNIVCTGDLRKCFYFRSKFDESLQTNELFLDF